MQNIDHKQFRYTGIHKRILVLVSFFLLMGCVEQPSPKKAVAELYRTAGIVITNEIDQPELIMEGLQVTDDKGTAYGIDFKKRLPYKLDLKTGEFRFLAAKGMGPVEFNMPSQMTLKDDSQFYVYDTSQDLIAHFINDQVAGKLPGYARHGVWLRQVYGMFWDGYLISAIKEPDKINILDFDNARPIAMLNLSDSTLTKHGIFSPTADNLDSLQKYPMLALDKSSGIIYYVFISDYTVMKHELNTGISSIASSYKPEKMRDRTIAFDYNNAYHYNVQFAKQFNEDRTQLVGIDILAGRLVVVHQNTFAEYFDDQDPGYIDYFGIVYDLPDLSNPREFTLPGKFLGVWNNKLLIEEDDDILNYTIGFYEFAESDH